MKRTPLVLLCFVLLAVALVFFWREHGQHRPGGTGATVQW